MLCMATLLHAQDASFYRKYAEKGDKEAMYKLADCYFTGTGGVGEDPTQGVGWLEKAAAKKYAPAQIKLADCYVNAIGTPKNYLKAWDMAHDMIDRGQPVGYYILAGMYKNGYYTPKNLGAWRQNLETAADKGVAEAQIELGMAYFTGTDDLEKPYDLEKAMEWFKKAAAQQNPTAEEYLAKCMELTGDPTKERVHALPYHKKEALLGDHTSQYIVALAYYEGNHTDISSEEARKCIDSAVASKDPKAYQLLGDMCFEGIGRQQDYKKAAEAYQKAISLGLNDRAMALAKMYQKGLGVSKDIQRAYSTYHQEAKAGNAEAMYELAYCYEKALGTTQNLPAAYAWYLKCAGEKEDGRALANLYRMKKYGIGTTANKAEARDFLLRGERTNAPEALHAMGEEYRRGDYVFAKDMAKAMEYYEKACEAKSYPTMALLGLAYYHGDSFLPQDYAKAFRYLREAAAHPLAISNPTTLAAVYKFLGACYRFGRGTEVDRYLANKYTGLAAEAGDEGSRQATDNR